MNLTKTFNRICKIEVSDLDSQNPSPRSSHSKNVPSLSGVKRERSVEVDICELARRYRKRIGVLPPMTNSEECWKAAMEIRAHEEMEARVLVEKKAQFEIEEEDAILKINFPLLFKLVRSI